MIIPKVFAGAVLALAVLLALALPVAFAGCGYSSAGGGSNRTVSGGGTVEVRMKGTVYETRELTIDKGTTVEWINDDPFQHTVTAVDKSFDSGQFGQGRSYERAFNEAGSFDYYCTIHPSMKGKIIVR